MADFSVVVPLYNKGAHVAATIQTALAQTAPPREIIVIDDASTDNGLAIVREIGHPSIRIIERDTPGAGGYAARNAGIEAASGAWIAFLDADDSWHPDHLKNLSAAIDKAPEPVGCAFSGIWIVENDTRRPYEVNERYVRPGVALDLSDIVEGWLNARDCPIWTGGAAFRRDVLIDAGLFPAGRAKRGGDKDLWVRAAAITKAVYSPEKTASFHQDTQNRVSNFTAHVDLPILVSTIDTLIPSADKRLRPLLKRLSNREIGRYARRCTKAGTPIPAPFYRALHMPQGVGQLAYLIGLSMIRPYMASKLK